MAALAIRHSVVVYLSGHSSSLVHSDEKTETSLAFINEKITEREREREKERERERERERGREGESFYMWCNFLLL